MSEGGIGLEVEATLPPPNLYNKAVLEAFQLAANKNEGIRSHPDLVVLLAGSFSKGLGNYYSDSDTLFITEENPITDSLSDLLPAKSIGSQLDTLVRLNPQYQDLGKYASLGGIIDSRFEDKFKDVKTWDVELHQRYNRASARRAVLLQRAYKNKKINPQIDNGEPNLIGSNFIKENDTLSQAIVNVCSRITDFNPTLQHKPERFHSVIAVLSSELGINAYEVTQGTLQKYKESIVSAIHNLRNSDGARYEAFMEYMRMNYLNYTRTDYYDFEDPQSVNPKSPQLKSAIERTEEGEPLLEFYRRFKQFPLLEELEEYINIRK